MSDLRDVNNEGQGHLVLTFKVSESGGNYTLTESDIGKPVAVSGNNEVSIGADGDTFCGKLISVSEEGDVASVQVKGVVTGISYTGEAPTVGTKLEMGGDKVVKTGVTASKMRGMIISVDTNNTTVDVLL